MKKFIIGLVGFIIGFMFAVLFTNTVNAETNITKIDTNDGSYYAEFEQPVDWIVIKQSTGALVWINDTTEYSLDDIKTLAQAENPSLIHSVTYWGFITGYGTFSNDNEGFMLPDGFQGNMWGTYQFIEALEDGKFYVDINGVSNVTYSYTDPIVIEEPPVEEPPEVDIVPEPPKPHVSTPVVTEEVTVITEDITPQLDYSPQTGDMVITSILFFALCCALGGFGGLIILLSIYGFKL